MSICNTIHTGRIWGVDYIRSTQNGNDSLMLISRAIAINVTGVGELIIFDLLKMGVKLSKSDSRQSIL